MTSVGAARSEPQPMPSLLLTTFAALDAAGITWCLLRGDADDLAQGARDVDVLVAPGDWPRLPGLLAGLGWLGVPAYGRGPAGFFVGRDSLGSWVRLDVAAELAFGRFSQLDTGLASACLARSERSGALQVLAPGDRFWALVLHCVLEKGHVADRHAARLRALVDDAADNGPLSQLVVSILPRGWDAARVKAAVRAGTLADLAARKGGMAASLCLRDPIGTSRRFVVRAVQRAVGFGRLLHRRWGVSVALLGADGAGKTTLAAAIAGDFGLPVRRIYMGMWSSTQTGIFGRVPGLAILARPFAACRKGLVAQYHLAHGRVVIFDRYTYDALIPPRGSLVFLKRLYFWVLAHSAPAPQMLVLLDAPGTLLFARKGEFDPVRLEQDRLAFLALQRRLSMQVVDAAQPPDAVRAQVTELLWERCLRRAGRG